MCVIKGVVKVEGCGEGVCCERGVCPRGYIQRGVSGGVCVQWGVSREVCVQGSGGHSPRPQADTPRPRGSPPNLEADNLPS